MDNNETQNQLSLGDLWSIFAGHFLVILAAAVLVFVAVMSYSIITYTPEYKSSATIYILRQDNEATPGVGTTVNSDFSLALSLVNDIKTLLTSHMVLDRVIENLGMPISYEKLSSMISIQNPASTRILEVSVRAPSPMDAKVIVDELCIVGAESIMNTLGINQVNLIDAGTYNITPDNSMVTPYSFVAAALAAVVVYGIYALVYILDDKIKTPDDVEKYLQLTVLGLIPNVNGEKGGRNGEYKYGKNKYGKYGKYGGYRQQY